MNWNAITRYNSAPLRQGSKIIVLVANLAKDIFLQYRVVLPVE